MKALIGFVAVTLLVFSSVGLAGGGILQVVEKAGVGKYIADAEGKALYWFKMDTPNKSACAGACVENWPLYHRDKVIAPEGVPDDDFGTITRDDGKLQTTFRSYPLYYFAGDDKAGDTNGQGLKDVWFVIDPDNFPPK